MSKGVISGQVRIGIIGAGLIGQTHSMMLRQTADRTDGSARVAAVADVAHAQAERLAARWPGARALTSSREIIEDPDIDAVWICTPTALHRADCVAAARAGIAGRLQGDSRAGEGTRQSRAREILVVTGVSLALLLAIGATLNTLHNVYFYLDIMAKIRKAIRFGNLREFCSALQARLETTVSD